MGMAYKYKGDDYEKNIKTEHIVTSARLFYL